MPRIETIDLCDFREMTATMSDSREILCQDDKGNYYAIAKDDYEVANGRLVLFINWVKNERSR